jgi:hypothetical protein
MVQRIIVPTYLVKFLVKQRKLISRKEKELDSKVSVLKDTEQPIPAEHN